MSGCVGKLERTIWILLFSALGVQVSTGLSKKTIVTPGKCPSQKFKNFAVLVYRHVYIWSQNKITAFLMISALLRPFKTLHILIFGVCIVSEVMAVILILSILINRSYFQLQMPLNLALIVVRVCDSIGIISFHMRLKKRIWLYPAILILSNIGYVRPKTKLWQSCSAKYACTKCIFVLVVLQSIGTAYWQKWCQMWPFRTLDQPWFFFQGYVNLYYQLIYKTPQNRDALEHLMRYQYPRTWFSVSHRVLL